MLPLTKHMVPALPCGVINAATGHFIRSSVTEADGSGRDPAARRARTLSGAIGFNRLSHGFFTGGLKAVRKLNRTMAKGVVYTGAESR